MNFGVLLWPGIKKEFVSIKSFTTEFWKDFEQAYHKARKSQIDVRPPLQQRLYSFPSLVLAYSSDFLPE